MPVDGTLLSCGAATLDLTGRRLIKDGRSIHLSPKALSLLEALLRAQPRALSKTELQEHLWPGTFVVEGNLANLVREVRRAVEDDPSRPERLRTVHGYGYAWQPPAEADTPAVGDGEPHCWLCLDDRHVALRRGRHLLGRDPASVFPLQAKIVSRRHAEIEVDEAWIVLTDLGSRNGTYVGGVRLTQPRILTGGEEIGIGPYRLTLVGKGAPSEQTWPLEERLLEERRAILADQEATHVEIDVGRARRR
jgi:DNA-binding winged helix-turn-helix (wHTH) protein